MAPRGEDEHPLRVPGPAGRARGDFHLHQHEDTMFAKRKTEDPAAEEQRAALRACFEGALLIPEPAQEERYASPAAVDARLQRVARFRDDYDRRHALEAAWPALAKDGAVEEGALVAWARRHIADELLGLLRRPEHLPFPGDRWSWGREAANLGPGPNRWFLSAWPRRDEPPAILVDPHEYIKQADLRVPQVEPKPVSSAEFDEAAEALSTWPKCPGCGGRRTLLALRGGLAVVACAICSRAGEDRSPLAALRKFRGKVCARKQKATG